MGEAARRMERSSFRGMISKAGDAPKVDDIMSLGICTYALFLLPTASRMHGNIMAHRPG
jgi:hypothetical protein